MAKSETLSEQEEKLLYHLLEQEEIERVAPKFEKWREPARYKIAEGGRGAGAKSWSATSLLVQMLEYADHQIKVLCVREIQQTLAESSHSLISAQIDRLGYDGWRVTDEYIENTKNGSFFKFKGLKDIRASRQIKSYEGYDILFAEEAASISYESWRIILPTIRKSGSEIWAIYNREEEIDPVHDIFVNNERPNSIILHLEPGSIDNPWFDQTTLPQEMEEDFKRDPDWAEHVWYGEPRKQGQKAVLSRVRIRAAMERSIDAVGTVEVGCDVARFGDDRTIMYKRHGLKIVESREFVGQDTQRTAKEAWDMAGRDPSILIKVDDTGVGGGVTDRLNEFGAKVMPVNFGGSPMDIHTYTSTADEMWFTFPADEADIPDDKELMQELSGREYDYDRAGRKKIEAKSKYKTRTGRSPDKADALLLTFYQGSSKPLPDKHRQAMRERRNRN